MVNKTNNHLSPQSLNIRKTMTYDGNSGPDLRQAQKCGRVKSVNEIPTLNKIHQLKLSIGFYLNYWKWITATDF